MQFRIHLLNNDEHRLHGGIVGDVSSSLFVAEHSKFHVVDLIGDRIGKAVDLIVPHVLIQRILNGDKRLQRRELKHLHT